MNPEKSISGNHMQKAKGTLRKLKHTLNLAVTVIGIMILVIETVERLKTSDQA
jgi:hypothetical protein